ncbi:MAG TPA: hypothetical protein VGD05_01155 [Pyrinomonadaceae bacterium]|jgi:hypothetical protein
MNLNERIRFDSFVRIDVFGKENAADFPAVSKGAQLFAEMGNIIEQLNQTGAEQAAAISDSRQSHSGKDAARENVRRRVAAIVRTAEGISNEIPAMKNKFRSPGNNNDQKLLAAARAFHTEAAPFKATFIEYGLRADFLDELEAAITDFDQTLTATSAARGEQVASTADIGETVREGMTVRQQLDVIARNKYADNTGKLAAWESASRVEHHKAKKPEPVPTI